MYFNNRVEENRTIINSDNNINNLQQQWQSSLPSSLSSSTSLYNKTSLLQQYIKSINIMNKQTVFLFKNTIIVYFIFN